MSKIEEARKALEESQPTEQQLGPYMLIAIDQLGEPQIDTNMPYEIAVACLDFAKFKLHMQFTRTVGQMRADAAVKKPNIVKAVPIVKP